MTRLAPYSEYTDSGVEWLGKVPAGWKTVPAKAVFSERRERNLADDQQLTPSQKYGVLPQAEYIARTGNRVVLNLTGADNMRHAEPGDYISHLRSFQGGLEYSEIPGKVSAAYTVLAPRTEVVGTYFKYLFKSVMYVQALQTTTDQLRDGQSIRYAQFALIPVCLPPISDQAAIAEFLDRETAGIETFIADQEELVALLTERRAAKSSQAFFGVVELTGSRQGSSETAAPLGVTISEVDDRVGGEALDLLSVSIHQGVVPWGSMHDKQPAADDFSKYKVTKVDDIVLNRMRAFQGAVGLSRQRGMVSPDYAVFRVRPGSVPEYVAQLIRSHAFVDAIKLRLRGIGDESSGAIRTPRINSRDLLRIKVSLPNHAGQQKVLDYLDRTTADINAAIAEAREAIVLSKERRAALISAAVTGKIDVRGLVGGTA